MKKTVILFAVFAAALLAAGIAYAVSNGMPGSNRDVKTTFIPAAEAEKWVAEQEAQKEALLGKTTPDPEQYLSLYDRSMLHASEEQKARLENLDDLGYTNALPCDYTKQILIIMGDLPEDTPHLTLEQATEIIDTFTMKADTDLNQLAGDLVNAFNRTAGAPDIEYGSGMSHIIYFLDDENASWIDIFMGFVYYHPSREAEAIRML